jgi:hypothetical protein
VLLKNYLLGHQRLPSGLPPFVRRPASVAPYAELKGCLAKEIINKNKKEIFLMQPRCPSPEGGLFGVLLVTTQA